MWKQSQPGLDVSSWENGGRGGMGDPVLIFAGPSLPFDEMDAM